MDIKALRNEDTGQTSWKVLVGLSTSGHQPACNHLVEMTINNNLLKGLYEKIILEICLFTGS